jgi:hypothetical protein
MFVVSPPPLRDSWKGRSSWRFSPQVPVRPTGGATPQARAMPGTTAPARTPQAVRIWRSALARNKRRCRGFSFTVLPFSGLAVGKRPTPRAPVSRRGDSGSTNAEGSSVPTLPSSLCSRRCERGHGAGLRLARRRGSGFCSWDSWPSALRESAPTSRPNRSRAGRHGVG